MSDVIACISLMFSLAAAVVSISALWLQNRQTNTEEEQARRFQIDCVGIPHWVKVPNWPKEDAGGALTTAWGIAFDYESDTPLPSIYLKATGFGNKDGKPSATFDKVPPFTHVKRGSWFMRLEEGQGMFELVEISDFAPIPIVGEFYTVDAECVDTRGRTWGLSKPSDENRCIVWQQKK